MPKRPDDPVQLGLFDGDAPEPPAPDAGAGSDVDALPAPPAAPQPAPAPDPRFRDGPLPDAAARARIVEDLETNLLVEAGAGSGKTTALVQRMVALVRSGAAAVDEIAAVTFTRKAAAELRQRFQTELEEAGRRARAAGEVEVAGRLDDALRGVDRAFLGTIHAFCARLLRERPVEAGVDPDFQELYGAEEMRQRRAFWRSFLEQAAATDDPLLTELAAVRLMPSQLQALFDELVSNPDVEFPVEPADPPPARAVAAVRARLGSLLDRGAALMPAEPDPKMGWDELQSRIRLLLFLRRVADWDQDVAFLDLLGEEVAGRSYRVVQKRWPDGGAAKALGQEWGELRDGAVTDVLDQWWAHRYPVAIGFARRAAEAYREERRRSGRLDFQDLLMYAAAMLRANPDAREELGRRYRRVLVDEFQDTDPVQAEVLLLLSSPPDGRPWQQAEPRPGALFVVGDPKQSIYRFRRADIAVYNLVRDRFAAFGDRIELVANFRSLPAIEAVVDGVFGEEGRFGPGSTPYQAAFAPLRTRRRPDPERAGVLHYRIDPEGTSHAAAAADDAGRLVPWIARQVRAGRSAGDFLILARHKSELATYARALEAWSIPAQVTGGGVDRAEELRELLVLLEALADPTDPVRVVAVLVGLFFGIDHDQLVDWVLEGGRDGRFDITRSRPDDGSEVARALNTLHGWWDRARREPADILVGRILDELGLVPLAAARDLGELRAGSLLFALDALRVAALSGDTSLASAVDALHVALDADEAEAPLQPVRRGVARVMTLHQAKGLEAPVVVLAHPVGGGQHPVTRHIERRPDGTALGHLVVQERDGPYRVLTLARPPGWETRAEEERRYEEAEQDRLLYVAATRAAEVLVVARQGGRGGDSTAWAGLHGWLDEHGTELRLEPTPAPDAPAMEPDAAQLDRAVSRISEERARRGRPGYVIRTATQLAKSGGGVEPDDDPVALGPLPDPKDGPDPGYRGRSWGSVVHGALEAAARGASGVELRRIGRALLLEWERPVEAGEPVELDELVALVERVRGSELWARSESADLRLAEAPFAYRDDEDDVHDPAAPPGAERVLEGVVDLAFREADGWVIVDYKTDIGTDPDFPRRQAAYRRQVELYAMAWEQMTGESVKERVLLYTARPDDPAVRW